MKRLLLFLLLGALPQLSADWHEPEASHRLTIRTAVAGQAHYIDLRRLVLPVGAENSVAVTDRAGRKQPFYLHKDQVLFLPAAVKPDDYFIYFGFRSPRGASDWDIKKYGELPEPHKLRIRVVNAHNLAPSDREWRERRLANLDRNHSNRILSNRRSLNKLLFEKITAPILFFRYTPEKWLQTNKLRDQRIFEAQLRQLTYKATRPNRRVYPRSHVRFFLLPWQDRYYFNRLRGTFDQLSRQPINWRQEMDKVLKEPEGAPYRDIQKLFGDGRARVRGESPVREINLPKRPFDSDGNFAIRYAGKLWVPESGDYEFGTGSNSLAILKIDDKTVVQRQGIVNPGDVKIESGAIRLERGLHAFELLYHKSLVTSTVSAWHRRAGEPTWRLLSDENFHPACPAEPLDLVSRERSIYPLVTRNNRYLLHSGKLSKESFEEFKIVSPGKLAFQWELDGKTLPGQSFSRLALPTDRHYALKLIPEDNRWTALELPPFPANYPQVSLEGAPTLKLWLPKFLYSDETLDAFREINSRLTVDYTAELKITPSRPQNVFPAQTSFIAVPGKAPEAVNRFAPDIVLKERHPLNGAQLKNGLDVTLELSIPGLPCDRRTVRFLPVTALPEDLTVDPAAGLTDAAGNPVVVVLNRPGTHQVRRWELLKTLRNGVLPAERLLVIGEDFGPGGNDFSSALSECAAARDRQLAFIPIANRTRYSGRMLLESLPELLRQLRASRADTIVLLPPSPARNGGLADWENIRILALLIEQASLRPDTRKIILATPIPSFDPRFAPMERDFENFLRRAAREYGIEFLEFSDKLRKRPDLLPSSSPDGLAAALPVSRAAEYAEELLRHIE